MSLLVLKKGVCSPSKQASTKQVLQASKPAPSKQAPSKRKKSENSNESETNIFVANQRQFAREIGKEARRQNGVVRNIFVARANPDYNGRQDRVVAIITSITISS